MKLLSASFWAASLTLTWSIAPARAGDDTIQTTTRREFKQSTSYPYIFVATGYLETEGPKPMRFAAAVAECANRAAPLLPPLPPPLNRVIPVEPPPPAPAATPASVPAAFPPPANGPAARGPDLTKMPEEVMSYFKNPYDSAPRGSHLFDPIFEPSMKQGPRSKATYRVEAQP